MTVVTESSKHMLDHRKPILRGLQEENAFSQAMLQFHFYEKKKRNASLPQSTTTLKYHFELCIHHVRF